MCNAYQRWPTGAMVPHVAMTQEVGLGHQASKGWHRGLKPLKQMHTVTTVTEEQ